MPRDNIDFTDNLIKGKIAQTIFERMFIEMDSSIVIPFGYEYTATVLHQFQKGMNEQDRQDLINVRNMPDYLLVSQEKRNALLVEVKFRRKGEIGEIKKIANELYNRWPSAWLFLATPEGFFFGKSITVRIEGKIPPLPTNYLPEVRQKEYLALLNKYLADKKEKHQVAPDVLNKPHLRKKRSQSTSNNTL